MFNKFYLVDGKKSTLGRFVLYVLMSAVMLSGCAQVREKNIYPEKIASINRTPSADVVDLALRARIELPVPSVWDSLVTVLNQHAFIWHIDSSSPSQRELSYSDVTKMHLEGADRVVSLPYTVKLESNESAGTAITILCRWDIITDEEYRRDRVIRFEELKRGMRGEANTLIQRVATQSKAKRLWAWLSEGELK